MKASYLLRQNIKTILKARGQTAHELAVWCHKDDSWLSKILSDKATTEKDDKAKGLPLRHIDRIASFFGVQVYQLFQPGISHLAERRQGRDRRAGGDRRLSAVVLSEKPGDVDVMSLIRALSPRGRQRALAHLVDLVNDELPRLRTPEADAADRDHTAGTPRPKPVRTPRESRRAP